MKNRVNLVAVQNAVDNRRQKIVHVNIIAEPQANQIFVLVAAAEVVDD